MNKFYCSGCQNIFEAEGRKIEYTNPVYGPCWERKATCPKCGNECDEYRQKSLSKKNFNFDSYVNDLKNRGSGGCCSGGGCCG